MKKILSISIVLLLAAGCNSTTTTNTNQSNSENTNTTASNTQYCTGSPYPIDPKYKKLTYLGQIFTANDCGDERLKEVAGGEDYTLGSSITIKGYPGAEFKKTLLEIGYTCDGGDERVCQKWTLKNTVKAKDLTKLWRYHPSIDTDNCIKCS